MSESSRKVNAQTAAYAAGLGWTLEKMEYYDAFQARTKDWLGFVDFIAKTPEGEFVAIQSTSDATGGNSGARVRKIKSPKIWPKAMWWLGPNHRIEVWAWKRDDLKRIPVTAE